MKNTPPEILVSVDKLVSSYMEDGEGLANLAPLGTNIKNVEPGVVAKLQNELLQKTQRKDKKKKGAEAGKKDGAKGSNDQRLEPGHKSKRKKSGAKTKDDKKSGGSAWSNNEGLKEIQGLGLATGFQPAVNPGKSAWNDDDLPQLVSEDAGDKQAKQKGK